MKDTRKRVILNLVPSDNEGVYVHHTKPLYSDDDLVNVNITDFIEDDDLRFRDYNDSFTTEFRIPDAPPKIEDEEASEYVKDVSIAHDTMVVNLEEEEKPTYKNKLLGALKKLIPSKRRLIQLYAALLFNANIKGYIQGNMYQGNDKFICSPGINCYSCPGAIGSCPLGALQNSIGDHKYSFYALGIIFLYALMFGRFICGWLCPFGLVQDLLHKIKTPKLKKSPVTRALSYLKYVILVLFVFVFAPIGVYPAFCKFICPAGILEAAFGILPQDTELLTQLGPLFTWKFTLFICFVVICIFVYRAFCRFICPMGAIYGIFNKISFFGIKLEKSKCTSCGRCITKCKMDIRHVGDHECISCGDCIDVCPTKAISFKGPKIFLAPNEINIPEHASYEELEALEQKQQEINTKTKKRNNTIKTIIGIIMAVVLAGALIYYNVIRNDELWNWVDSLQAVDTDTNTDTDSSADTETDTSTDSGSTDTESDTETGTETEAIQKPPIGNKVGNTCPGSELQVFDEHGISAQTFDPTKTGKVTVINFWYTTCASCIAELPYFDELATQYKDSVVVVAVHSTDPSFASAFDFVKANYPETEMVFVKDTALGTGNDAYYMDLGGSKYNTYPMTVIIDEDGVITFTKRIAIEKDVLFDEVEKALGK
ncbi:MAG: 4Fe-4S binding protein [Clostridia bacterium]|nr:4Fe-4S binding protein [Clostridia bacterium]